MNKDPIEFTNKLIETYSIEYTERLRLLYSESYLENPEAFPLADSSKIDAYILKGNEKVLGWTYFLLLYQGSGQIENLGEIPLEEYSKLKNYNNDNEFVSQFINGLTKSNKRPYLIDKTYLNFYLHKNKDFYENIEHFLQVHKNNIAEEMLRKLREDGSMFIEHIDNKASYYAQNAYRYAYTELDFSPVINAVNDKDFEYALNESIACFDQSLYLAAVSTAGTALENLIIRILEINTNSTVDNSHTELGELAGRLRKAGIIDNREKRRIMLAANFRNLASHANKGRVIRQDAKLVYQEIFNLASKVFDV